ncbi:DUF6049 family protein [Frondihabitans cladoniiphilus]|uniref:Uncharacterized protein n=1 Tax=Frondihabitans cladoniiphilus TaxID=715785 RepID=A0ABP8W0I5_9MICO
MRTPSVFAAAVLAAVALAVGLPGASATAAPAAVSSAAASSAAVVAGATGATSAAGATSATAEPVAVTTATPSSTPAADAVTVQVSPQNDGVVAASSDLTVVVTVHNGTDDALDAGTLRLYLDRTTFSSRSQLDSWRGRSDSTTTDTLGGFLTSASIDAIPAGTSSAQVTVTVPWATLGLSGQDWGAKAFGVRYSSGKAAVAEEHSSIVYNPSDSFEATKLTVAVPLTVPSSTSGVISSDALAAYTSATGVLTQELKAVRGKPVAIGIDPMILASIRLLGNAAPPTAIVWLNSLVTAPNESFPLAYGDADLSALRQAGAASIPAPIDFTAQIAAQAKAFPDSYVMPGATAQATPTTTADPEHTEPATEPTATDPAIPPTSSVPTTESLLAFPYTARGIAWPLESTVAADDLDTFTTSGFSTTILSSDNVSTGSTTENAHATVAGHDALVTDDEISSLLRTTIAAGTDAQWQSDMATLSAEMATLTHERPSDARTLLATIGRGWATDGSRLEETLTALDALSWSTPSRLGDTLAATPTAGTLVAKKASSTRIAALQPLVASDAALLQFSSALKQPELVTATERVRMLALASTSWQNDVTALRAEVAKLGGSVTKTTQQVRIIEGSSINILGDRSSLPVQVANDTASTAVVVLRVVPSNYYLSVEKNNLTVTLQPNSQQRVTVPVQSVANGKVDLTFSLTSGTGVPISAPSIVAINVQAGWETLITALFAAAVVLLFGGGIYRSLRKRRRARAEAAAGTASGSSTSGASTEDSP